MDLPQLFLRLLLHQAVQLFVVLDQRCREQTDVETQRVVAGAETHRATEKRFVRRAVRGRSMLETGRSEEHTSELQSLMRISYAVFCLKKKKRIKTVKSVRH